MSFIIVWIEETYHLEIVLGEPYFISCYNGIEDKIHLSLVSLYFLLYFGGYVVFPWCTEFFQYQIRYYPKKWKSFENKMSPFA